MSEKDLQADFVYFHYASPADSSFMYKKIGLNIPTDIFYIDDGIKENFFVPAFEYDYLKKYSKHPGINKLDELSGFGKNYFDSIINFLKQKNKTIKVPPVFPSWLLMKMLKNKIEVEIDNFYFLKSSLYKNIEEIKIIKKTANGAKDCTKYIESVLSTVSIKNKFIYYKGEKLSAKLLANMIGVFLLNRNIKSEFTTVACGEFSYYPHCQIDHFLRQGKPIIIDLGVRDIDNGYYVDVSRTYCIGKPENDKFVNLYETIKNVKSGLEDGACPGRLISEVYREAASLMSEHGIKITKSNLNSSSDLICHHSLGHGVGRDLHELPIIDENATVNFEKNMVIAIEPGAYIKGCGGIRIEDTYLITEKGAENLTAGKYNFLIKK